jgi:putative endonuclease
MFTVYVLYSESHNKHYVGYTSDLKNRLDSHNIFANSGFTVRYRPWKLIYTEQFSIKSEVIKREKFLKSGKGREFIKTIPH